MTFLARKFDTFQSNSNLQCNMTALHRACEIGDLSKACLLIEKKAEVTSVNSVRNWLANKLLNRMLMLSISNLNDGKICPLLKKHGKTCLHTACIANHIDIVRLLLNVGAAPQQLDYCGRKSFSYLGGDLNREEKKSLMTELKQIVRKLQPSQSM